MDQMKFPSKNTVVYESFTPKGTKHISAEVAGKYIFTFSTAGKLLYIDDLSMGSWDTYGPKKADLEWWLSRRGSMKVYEETVLPCVKKFMSAKK